MTGPDRMKLPIRRAMFGGVTNRTLEGSQPDWSLIGHPEAPEGADASGDRMSGGIAGRPPDEGHIRVLRPGLAELHGEGRRRRAETIPFGQ